MGFFNNVNEDGHPTDAVFDKAFKAIMAAFTLFVIMFFAGLLP